MTDSFLDFVLEQLEPFGGVAARAMFGGHGLYKDGSFFAILFKGILYFKVDDATRGAYLERGMSPFRPGPKQTLKSYYQVPAEVIEKPKAIGEWAAKAVECALRIAESKKSKPTASSLSARSRRVRGDRSARR